MHWLLYEDGGVPRLVVGTRMDMRTSWAAITHEGYCVAIGNDRVIASLEIPTPVIHETPAVPPLNYRLTPPETARPRTRLYAHQFGERM